LDLAGAEAGLEIETYTAERRGATTANILFPMQLPRRYLVLAFLESVDGLLLWLLLGRQVHGLLDMVLLVSWALLFREISFASDAILFFLKCLLWGKPPQPPKFYYIRKIIYRIITGYLQTK
jgi:hypothetical protein